MIGYLGLSALICGSDLAIKETVKEKVEENSKTYVFNERLILTKFYNPGAALGALKDRQSIKPCRFFHFLTDQAAAFSWPQIPLG